jgi:hypothetical protein
MGASPFFLSSFFFSSFFLTMGFPLASNSTSSSGASGRDTKSSTFFQVTGPWAMEETDEGSVKVSTGGTAAQVAALATAVASQAGSSVLRLMGQGSYVWPSGSTGEGGRVAGERGVRSRGRLDTSIEDVSAGAAPLAGFLPLGGIGQGGKMTK